jgi:hypothetical protein
MIWQDTATSRTATTSNGIDYEDERKSLLQLLSRERKNRQREMRATSQ